MFPKVDAEGRGIWSLFHFQQEDLSLFIYFYDFHVYCLEGLRNNKANIKNRLLEADAAQRSCLLQHRRKAVFSPVLSSEKTSCVIVWKRLSENLQSKRTTTMTGIAKMFVALKWSELCIYS